MSSKRYFWLKLKEDFFEEDTLQWLEEQNHGKEYCLFYLKLCLKSLKNNGILIRNVGSMLVPYDTKKLSELTKTHEDTVIVAMELLKKIGLIKILDSGEIYITQLENMVGSESKWAEKKRLQRSKKGEDNVPPKSLDCPTENREQRKSTELEQELEQQQDIERLLNCSNKEAQIIIKAAKEYFPVTDPVVVVKEKYKVIQNGNFNNPLGALVTAIKEDWLTISVQNKKNTNFNNFEPGNYDYEDIERKLLGWDKDDE